MTELLKVENLQKHFPVSSGFLGIGKKRTVAAVSGVSFVIHEGETLGIVGESGSGKTTVSKVVLGLEEPTGGSVQWQGTEVAGESERRLRWFRQSVQAVFQDPFSALSPRQRVGDIIGEPLLFVPGMKKRDREQRVEEVMEQVGISPALRKRFPHEFSGGQRQRVAIARALTVKPKLIILDEPVSALDLSIRAQVLNLLKDLQETLGVSFLFIAHDLSVVEYMSHRVAVMYLGKIVEIAPADELYKRATHPYSKALVAAIPPRHPAEAKPVQPLQGEIPSPLNPPPGCAFSTRCPMVEDRCRSEEPELREVRPGQFSACHFAERLL